MFTICSCKKAEYNVQNSYHMLNVARYKDCEAYAMVFKRGNDCLFRYSLSGPCENLELNNLLISYDTIIKSKFLKEESLKDKKIIIELYSYTNLLRDSLVQRTEKYFDVKAKVNKEWDEGFEIQIQ